MRPTIGDVALLEGVIYQFCCTVSFFFLMIRRPPRSTLFPTRRSSDLHNACSAIAVAVDRGTAPPVFRIRSEEHTSELQSRRDLVCRLLLEKKKKASPQI